MFLNLRLNKKPGLPFPGRVGVFRAGVGRGAVDAEAVSRPVRAEGRNGLRNISGHSVSVISAAAAAGRRGGRPEVVTNGGGVSGRGPQGCHSRPSLQGDHGQEEGFSCSSCVLCCRRRDLRT